MLEHATDVFRRLILVGHIILFVLYLVAKWTDVFWLLLIMERIFNFFFLLLSIWRFVALRSIGLSLGQSLVLGLEGCDKFLKFNVLILESDHASLEILYAFRHVIEGLRPGQEIFALCTLQTYRIALLQPMVPQLRH